MEPTNDPSAGLPTGKWRNNYDPVIESILRRIYGQKLEAVEILERENSIIAQAESFTGDLMVIRKIDLSEHPDFMDRLLFLAGIGTEDKEGTIKIMLKTREGEMELSFSLRQIPDDPRGYRKFEISLIQ